MQEHSHTHTPQPCDLVPFNFDVILAGPRGGWAKFGPVHRSPVPSPQSGPVGVADLFTPRRWMNPGDVMLQCRRSPKIPGFIERPGFRVGAVIDEYWADLVTSPFDSFWSLEYFLFFKLFFWGGVMYFLG